MMSVASLASTSCVIAFFATASAVAFSSATFLALASATAFPSTIFFAAASAAAFSAATLAAFPSSNVFFSCGLCRLSCCFLPRKFFGGSFSFCPCQCCQCSCFLCSNLIVGFYCFCCLFCCFLCCSLLFRRFPRNCLGYCLLFVSFLGCSFIFCLLPCRQCSCFRVGSFKDNNLCFTLIFFCVFLECNCCFLTDNASNTIIYCSTAPK
mmetsp:Transcript_153061/g.271488  ORF Transcript_153061/g.271488 Transcript_153061/m.271488 type:complete len:208 (-) Transcript_153061:1403-2026(-)